MTLIRRHALLLLTLVMSLVLALAPAAGMAQQLTPIEEMGNALREAQTAFDAADDAYDALCETVFELQEKYDNGTEKEQLAVQDALLEAMIGEEDAYAALDEATTALEAVQAAHAELLAESGLKEQELSAKGYDSQLTILIWLDKDSVIWDIDVTVEGNEQDMAVGEDSFLVQFIGRRLPLSTNKKDEVFITLLPDARKTSEAVVNAVNGLARTGGKAQQTKQTKQSGPIIEPQAIADYLFQHGELPDNFITKKEAQKLGWDSSWNYVSDVAPGKSIGGDRFGNYEGLLPDKKGRQWYEADCYYTKGKRNAHRILYSNDGLVYYTDDHYESFTQMFPSK